MRFRSRRRRWIGGLARIGARFGRFVVRRLRKKIFFTAAKRRRLRR